MISVFRERSQQSKELAKGLTPDNQRLCDLTGEPSSPDEGVITHEVIVPLYSAPRKKAALLLRTAGGAGDGT